MDSEVIVNERVEVATIYRTGVDVSRICYPARMKYQGQVIEFTELGMRHPTAQGKRMVHVFEMSNGVNDYRLEFDAEALTWTLVAIREGKYERP